MSDGETARGKNKIGHKEVCVCVVRGSCFIEGLKDSVTFEHWGSAGSGL